MKTMTAWMISMRCLALAFIACLMSAQAHAQVGAQSMKYLAEMQGFVALQRVMVLPTPPVAAGGKTMGFKRSAVVYSQSMREAAQVMAKGGASVGMVSRMTGSGYFNNAARKYGASLGIKNAEADVTHAVAAFMSICRQAEKNEETSTTQAAQMLLTVQQRLGAQAALEEAGDGGRQAMADAVNVQTGLAFWNIQGRKKTSSNNNELAYYCGQNLKKLGVALDKL